MFKVNNKDTRTTPWVIILKCFQMKVLLDCMIHINPLFMQIELNKIAYYGITCFSLLGQDIFSYKNHYTTSITTLI